MALKLPGGLYALIDDGLRPELPMEVKARAALEGGARVVQLRFKHTGVRRALLAIREVVRRARSFDAVVIVNDRVDLALAGGAHGVHLGEADLPVADARVLLGEGRFIGATCRNLEQLHAAHRDGADHAGVGPIFQTSTKVVDHSPLGLTRFAELVRDSPMPVVGIAGISLDTIGSVAKCGAHAAAVASALVDAPDIAARARALTAAFTAQ